MIGRDETRAFFESNGVRLILPLRLSHSFDACCKKYMYSFLPVETIAGGLRWQWCACDAANVAPVV